MKPCVHTLRWIAAKQAQRANMQSAAIYAMQEAQRYEFMGAGLTQCGVVTARRPSTWRSAMGHTKARLTALASILTRLARPRQDEFDPRRESLASFAMFVAIVLVMGGLFY